MSDSKKWKSKRPAYSKKWRKTRYLSGLCCRCPKKRTADKAICKECAKRNLIYGKAHSATMKQIRVADHPKIAQALKRKNKKCKICGSNKHNGKGWHIDHCHVTKRFRGLLCQNCNIGLGHFKDNPKILKKAISYLKNE